MTTLALDTLTDTPDDSQADAVTVSGDLLARAAEGARVATCGFGKRTASIDDCRKVPLPEYEGDSYGVVAHADLLEYVMQRMTEETGLTVTPGSLNIALDKGRNPDGGPYIEGWRMFAVFTLDTGDGDTALAVVVTNSYDKCVPVQIAVGLSVFVCLNLMVSSSGDGFLYRRKHTTNVWQDVEDKVAAVAGGALATYADLQQQVAILQSITITDQTAAEILGRLAMGKLNSKGKVVDGILNPTMWNIARKDWLVARHDEFSPRTLWSLYNCANQALKKAAVLGAIDRHAELHEVFTAIADEWLAVMSNTGDADLAEFEAAAEVA